MRSTNSSKVLIFFLLLFPALLLCAQGNEMADYYLFPVFTKGIVITKGGRQEANLNYNMIIEQMIFEQKGKYLALDHLETVDTVIINNRKFIPSGNVFYELGCKRGNYLICGAQG